MEKLEKTLVDNRDDVEYELKQAKEKKLDPQLIDNLEKKLVQVKAQLRFVGEDAEAALDIGVTNIFWSRSRWVWSRSRHGHDEFGHDHVTVTIVCHRDRDRESR